LKHEYDPETVVLGVVGRPHGVRGEVCLRPHNQRGTSFEGLTTLLLDRNGVRTSWPIVSLRPTPGGVLAKLAGVDSREAAAALTLAEVRAPRATLPPLAPGEYYVDDIIGCAVFRQDGQALGTVSGTFWNGGQDVMITDDAGVERMIPLIPMFVVSVDAALRKVVVSWIDQED
jgi:16S rRNA processing protein RimM